MSEQVPIEDCEYCDGSGVDPEGEANGNPYGCIDCEGTGFSHGKQAQEQFYKQMNDEWAMIEAIDAGKR